MCTVVVEGIQKFYGTTCHTLRLLSLLRRGVAQSAVARWRPAPVAMGTDLQAAGGSRGKRSPTGWGGAGRQAGGQKEPLKPLPRLQVSSGV